MYIVYSSFHSWDLLYMEAYQMNKYIPKTDKGNKNIDLDE